jgi:hypothetical protein
MTPIPRRSDVVLLTAGWVVSLYFAEERMSNAKPTIPVHLTQDEIDYLWDQLFTDTQNHQLRGETAPMHYGLLYKLAVASLLPEGGSDA